MQFAIRTLFPAVTLALPLLGCSGDVGEGSDSSVESASPSGSVPMPGPEGSVADDPLAGPDPVTPAPVTPAPGGPGLVPDGPGSVATPEPTGLPSANPGVVPPTSDPALPPPEPVATPGEPAEEPIATRLGTGTMGGSGMSADRYAKSDVTRDGQNYFFMANGWGPGFASQTVSWNGTSFVVQSMEGDVGPNYEPASYPTVFCGEYSSSKSKECGLPRDLSAITSLRTGWRWAANGNAGDYNAAYDIWMAKADGSFGGFVMVWLRDPIGQQPAGSLSETGVTVENVPGTWDIWSGVVYETVPIVNWVRPRGKESSELEFDIMDFVRDAAARGYDLPGTRVNAVAVGFEIWEGPVTNLESQDFYLDVQ